MDKIPQDKYFDRELSWLQFNSRVLAEAIDPTNPPLERLKFTGIVSSNFDEFFMVRVASLATEDPLVPEIYAKAFSKDKDFYAFYRRMEAYKQAFGSGGSTMLLSPDNDFFRYFNDPSGLPSKK